MLPSDSLSLDATQLFVSDSYDEEKTNCIFDFFE